MARIYGTKTLAELKKENPSLSWEDFVSRMGYSIDPETGQVRNADYGIEDFGNIYSAWAGLVEGGDDRTDWSVPLWNEGYQQLPTGWAPDAAASPRYQSAGMQTLLDAQRSTDPGGRYIPANSAENPFDFPVWELSDQWKKTEQLEGNNESFMKWLSLMGTGLSLGSLMSGVSGYLGAAGAGALEGSVLGATGAGAGSGGLSGFTDAFSGFRGGLTDAVGLTGKGGLFNSGGSAGILGEGTSADSLWGTNQRMGNQLFGDLYNDMNPLDFGASGMNEFGTMTGQALPSDFNFTPGTFALGTTAAGGTAASALGGGDFWDSLFKGTPLGATLAKAGLNYALQSNAANQFENAANSASSRADALQQPQRQQYQTQLSQLMSNPAQFYATNPVVQGQLDLARQQFNANTGKMGTGGTQFNDYLKNVQNIASETFNDQANLLSGLGGFTQGTGYAGNVYGQLAGRGIDQQLQSQYFLPDLVDKIFGSAAKPQSEGLSGTQIVSL